MMTRADDVPDLRVLVFAPIGRDAALTSELLRRASVPCHLCTSVAEVCEGIQIGAGAVLLTEEALGDPQIDELAATLESQPAWSDISVLLFAGDDRTQASMRTLRRLEVLRNVTLLDRPVRVTAVLSTVQAALRSRQRQYELRDVLVALHSARNDAERANRLKDEFLATLSHELRTPLNAILGWVSMLRQTQIDAGRVPQILEIVERNAKAQAQLIADVLDVSRMITGRLSLNLEPVVVTRVLLDAVNTVRPAADAKGIDLHVAPTVEAPIINADAERLQQVFWNLLSNAVKFTPRGGRIDVALAPSDRSFLDVTIADTGIGLSPEFLPFAFERFRQADQSFTRTQAGLGLGLAIVKHLVEMHGGQVSVASGGVGQGATFQVRLPLAGVVLAKTSADDQKDQVAETFVRPDFSGRLILVVEDDPTTRELLVTMLSQCQARVEAVDSAQSAIDHIDQELPALILADLGMPEEDGLTMMRRIRRRPPDRGGRIPSVALSAYARGEDRRAAIAAGFDDFLTKPAMPADVLRMIERRLT